MKIKITQPGSGLVEYSSAESLELYINEVYGSAYEGFVERGGLVEACEDGADEPAGATGEGTQVPEDFVPVDDPNAQNGGPVEGQTATQTDNDPDAPNHEGSDNA